MAVRMHSFLNFFRGMPFLMKPYHFATAFLAALIYGFPSRRMIVIGVTGTKGKTTACSLVADILMAAGHKTGMATTVQFRVGDKIRTNDTKQTMLGRFALQKLLKRMADAGCRYAVIETSSEGIIQYRHRFIDYHIAVFTNLSPEHIERHGGFENYRAAKVKLFELVSKRKDSVGVYNLDDENVRYFLMPGMRARFGYTFKNLEAADLFEGEWFKVHTIELGTNGAKFDFDGERYETKLLGEFNVRNAASAICTAYAMNIPAETIRRALKTASAPPGRMEEVPAENGYKIFIDYSYEPKGLEEALKTLQLFKPKRTLVLIGSAGGGRDRWRRPVMGEVADKYADVVVVSTDDPYDEDPSMIIDDIMPGLMKNKSRALGENVFRITDRRQAIKKMIELAQKGDVLLFAGKGGETAMGIAGGKKISWNEKKIVEEALAKLS